MWFVHRPAISASAGLEARLHRNDPGVTSTIHICLFSSPVLMATPACLPPKGTKFVANRGNGWSLLDTEILWLTFCRNEIYEFYCFDMVSVNYSFNLIFLIFFFNVTIWPFQCSQIDWWIGLQQCQGWFSWSRKKNPQFNPFQFAQTGKSYA